MSKSFCGITQRNVARWVFLFFGLLVAARESTTAQLKEAQVTQIVKDVQLLPSQTAPRPAVVRDNVRQDMAVRTGDESRTELTFTDQTLARLGANTLFSFSEGTRNLDLGGGAMLLSVPKNGSATVRTAAVTAAVTGGTALFESNKGLPTKLLILEGIGRFYPTGHPEQAAIVYGGEMVMRTVDGKITRPIKFNARLVYKTSKLITSFPTLPNADLILAVIEEQEAELEGPATSASNDLIDTTDQAIAASTLPPPPPAGAPSKFGPLSVITSPNPYIINSGTQIGTDPTITTNSVTDLGKIYRDAVQDGDPATYFFGSTSAFDTSSGLDELLKQAGNLPIAAFQFNALQLTGDPTITIPAGSATKLALISVGGITSAAPGGALTFSGLDTVFLATQNGAINLTPDISFSGIPSLIFYARGAMSNLVLGSPVMGAGTNVRLFAEGSITVNGAENVGNFVANAGADFLNGAGHVVAQGINIVAANNINFATNTFAAPGGVQGVFLLAGANANIDIRTDQSVFNQASSFVEIHGTTINFTADPGGTTLQFVPSALANFFGGSGGIQAAETTFIQTSNAMEFISTGDIVANSIVGANDVTSSAGSVQTTGSLVANQIFVPNGFIFSGGDLTGFNSIIAGFSINVTNTLLSPGVTAGGDITAGHVEVQNVNPFGPPTLLTAGAGGITPFISPSGSGLQHTFNVTEVQSPQGIDFSGMQFGPANNGGLLTINAQSQVIGGFGIASVNFNGGDGDPAGSGGTFTLNTVGVLTVGANIDATTGIIPTNGTPSGAGGTVNLNSSGGAVTVSNARIRVSSNDPMGTVNRRSGASGGNINLSGGMATGTAIQVTNTAQLLSLLEAAAPGPGGLITVSASGTNSGIQVAGLIEADRGGVDVRHTGDSGAITLNGANLRADIIKVAALGNNGVLTIGNAVLNADSILKLYAGGSNGQIIFVADSTIGGTSMNIVAANTVTINNSVTVTTTGHLADVFTNNPNYTGSGGNGSTTGMFAGLGATTHPGMSPPPIGNPGGP